LTFHFAYEKAPNGVDVIAGAANLDKSHRAERAPSGAPAARPGHVILSFDVEEHHRIEASASLMITPSRQAHYRARVEPQTYWLLEQLGRHAVKATFFVVGQIAEHYPGLIRAIHRAGHEVASHGWDHQRVHNFTPTKFREEVRRSKGQLEQITGTKVIGYRAPTFSIMPQTAWAIDLLTELGIRYDSSIYPVRHDRYGVPQAPRTPFQVHGEMRSLLEIPPATLRVSERNLPVGGGGYFRLLPLFLLEYALRHAPAGCDPSVTMLYFHPWEFDPQQARLPLTPWSRFRTYVGMHRSRPRLMTLLSWGSRYVFVRAMDAAQMLDGQELPAFDLVRECPMPPH